MLLVLESRLLFIDDTYDALIDNTVEAYCRNYELHPTDYLPIVVVNDIVRYCRVVLLNGESKLALLDVWLRAR